MKGVTFMTTQLLTVNNPLIFSIKLESRKENFHFNRHSHQHAELYYILKGQCSMNISFEELTLTQNQGVLILPNAIHSLHTMTSEGCEFIHVHFDLKNLDIFAYRNENNQIISLDQIINAYDDKIFFNGSEELEATLHDALNYRNVNVILENIAFFKALIDIVNLEKKKKKHTYYKNSYVSKIIVSIKQNYDKDICVSDLADTVNISTRYLSKIFKEDTGVTIMQYLNNYRINRSIDLILNSTLPITTIAQKVGMNDISYFSKQFKKTIGESPSSYRKKRSINVTSSEPDMDDTRNDPYTS